METMIRAISEQAQELLKSAHIRAMLEGCTSEEEKQMKLAIASIYALTKAAQ